MKTFLKIAVFVGFLLCFAIAVEVGLDREAKRQKVVQKHNCEMFGDAINKFAGKEICPPTPKG